MLSIPSYQHLRRGQTKLIARNAMKGIIPEEIRLRPRSGVLTPFFDYGVLQKERAFVQQILSAPEAEWPRYVRRQWLLDVLDKKAPLEMEKMVVWNCVSFELWRRALREHGFA